jgi:hypothetical protein
VATSCEVSRRIEARLTSQKIKDETGDKDNFFKQSNCHYTNQIDPLLRD